MPLKDFLLEHGTLFRVHETVQGQSESAVRDELMRTRPEIFPVQIREVPELRLEPKYTDTWQQPEKRKMPDVPFMCGGGV